MIMVYLLGVAFVATRFGRWPSVLAAALSVAAFDFFFVSPYLTFAVADTQYLVTFAVMLVVACSSARWPCGCATRAFARASARSARASSTRSSRELGSLRCRDEIAGASARAIAEVFHGPAQVLLPDAEGRLVAVPAADAGVSRGCARARRSPSGRSTTRGRPASAPTPCRAAALYLPLPGGDRPVGVLGVRPHETCCPSRPDQMDLLEALARQIAAPLRARAPVGGGGEPRGSRRSASGCGARC